MADTPTTTPIDDPTDSISSIVTPSNPGDPGSSFLAETSVPQKSEDTLYNDFFQENGNDEMLMGAKKERSGLELLVSILEYAVILIVIIGVLFAVHVSIRSNKGGWILDNAPFLCPYFNYDIDIADEEKWCKTIDAIGKDYVERNKSLEDNILIGLNEYIPIRISWNILDKSPELQFVLSRFASKPHVNDVLDAFEKVRTSAQKILPQSDNKSNIECTGVSVTEWSILATQCVIYGGDIGSSNINWAIGSARIEALNFMEKIANTTQSSLILYNYPTTLSIENIASKDGQGPAFTTRTTLPIQVRYVPLVEKI